MGLALQTETFCILYPTVNIGSLFMSKRSLTLKLQLPICWNKNNDYMKCKRCHRETFNPTLQNVALKSFSFFQLIVWVFISSLKTTDVSFFEDIEHDLFCSLI